MKVLLDHNVPKRLRQFLLEHDVKLTREMDWAELANGELLTAAESSGFAVMVTGDKNLSYQQNLQGRKLALVVLSTNNWRVLRDNPFPVVQAVNAAKPGSFQMVMLDCPRGDKRFAVRTRQMHALIDIPSDLSFFKGSIPAWSANAQELLQPVHASADPRASLPQAS